MDIECNTPSRTQDVPAAHACARNSQYPVPDDRTRKVTTVWMVGALSRSFVSLRRLAGLRRVGRAVAKNTLDFTGGVKRALVGCDPERRRVVAWGQTM